jgi:glycosyltransferase involved in cell wall biosynthesis
VVEGESGFVIEADDASALRDRLERLANDPALCARMGKRSREVGEARFDMQKNANHIADMLLGLCRHGQSGESARKY